MHLDHFPALTGIDFLRHAFTGRVPGLDVQMEREAALARLEEHHLAARRALDPAAPSPFVTGTQVHGREVAIVDAQTAGPVEGVDGLITNTAGVTLGIYVADCCAIYLVDPKRRAIGLLHSGKKGTELGIVTAALEKMKAAFGCNPAEMIAQLSPCIRPPRYEIDFAAQIVGQCRAAGVREVFDCNICTASHRERYYSYRAELGKTGRMLALLKMSA